jgi:pyruvate/oxaloacetate carboxyltransferase
VKMGVELEKMGCDSIGIKDMSGIIQPQIAFNLVKELKAGRWAFRSPAHARHRGLGAASYLAAIDAGVDCVEVSIVPFANGTSQPDTQRMLALLEGIRAARSSTPEALGAARLFRGRLQGAEPSSPARPTSGWTATF